MEKQGFIIEYEFSVNNVLSRSFSVISQNPVVFFGLPLAAAMPATVINLLSVRAQFGGLALAIDFILGLIIQGAVAYAVYQALRDNKVSLGEAVSIGMARAGILFLLALLTGLCTLLGLVALIIPGLILTCMWAVAIQSCVIEDLGVIESMKRSAELTQGYRLRIFGLLMLVGLLGGLLAGGIGGLAALVIAALSPSAEGSQWIVSLAEGLSAVPMTAFNCVMAAIIYADLRAVKEGIGIDSLLNVFD